MVPSRSLLMMASSEDSTMEAIRCVAFRDSNALVSRRREGAQVGHHAQVFRVEAATLSSCATTQIVPTASPLM